MTGSVPQEGVLEDFVLLILPPKLNIFFQGSWWLDHTLFLITISSHASCQWKHTNEFDTSIFHLVPFFQLYFIVIQGFNKIMMPSFNKFMMFFFFFWVKILQMWKINMKKEYSLSLLLLLLLLFTVVLSTISRMSAWWFWRCLWRAWRRIWRAPRNKPAFRTRLKPSCCSDLLQWEATRWNPRIQKLPAQWSRKTPVE